MPGFPPDFVGYLKRSLPEIAKRRIKVVSNGGGGQSAGREARAGGGVRRTWTVAEDRGGRTATT